MWRRGTVAQVSKDKPLYRLPTQARGKATCAAIFEATARILETRGEARLNTNLIAETKCIGTGPQGFRNLTLKSGIGMDDVPLFGIDRRGTTFRFLRRFLSFKFKYFRLFRNMLPGILDFGNRDFGRRQFGDSGVFRKWFAGVEGHGLS